MKRLIFMFLLIGATIIYFGCSENNPFVPDGSQSDQVTNSLAKKPAPSLTGITDATFTFTPPNFWDGTIDFDGIDGDYGIRFTSLSDLKNYSQASPFEEFFEIYDRGEPSTVYMTGQHSGVVSLKNSKFRANGEILEAYGIFSVWEGRNTHMYGIIIWNPDGSGLPATALGTLRIN